MNTPILSAEPMTPALGSGPAADAVDPTVLILEDDVFIALDLEDMCEALGYGVVGPFASTSRAIDRIEAMESTDLPHHALLDLDVVDGTSYGLAARLRALGVRVTFVTARNRNARRCHPEESVLDKPLCSRELSAHLTQPVS